MPASQPEPPYELRPQDPTGPQSVQPRWKGPGRLELGYQARIRELEERQQQESELQAQLEAARREVELSALVERGTNRRMDRLEEQREQERAELETLREQGNRLLVALGAMQRENELLRGELEDALPAGKPLRLKGSRVRRGRK